MFATRQGGFTYSEERAVYERRLLRSERQGRMLQRQGQYNDYGAQHRPLKQRENPRAG
jgi:hypothetical protein